MEREKEMMKICFCLLAGFSLISLVACTSARENTELNATTPTTINSDADRRAIYNNAPATAPIPAPRRLDNQASEINRQKNIEERGVNKPHNKPIEVRTREFGRPVGDSIL